MRGAIALVCVGGAGVSDDLSSAERTAFTSPVAPCSRFEPRVNDKSCCFAVLNRHKKIIALDMKNPQGREVFMKLAAPWLGQHSEEILRGIGYSEAEVDALFTQRIRFPVIPYRLSLRGTEQDDFQDGNPGRKK